MHADHEVYVLRMSGLMPVLRPNMERRTTSGNGDSSGRLLYRDFPLRPVRRHASQSAALKFIAATVYMGQRRDHIAAGKILGVRLTESS